MQLKYKFKVDFDAKQYIGINLVWDYNRRTVCCSMKDYIKQALTELKHIPSDSCHHSAPSRVQRPDYGALMQYAHDNKQKRKDRWIKYRVKLEIIMQE